MPRFPQNDEDVTSSPPLACNVTLGPPERFDVSALANSTIRSLKLLSPWCEPSNRDNLWFAKDIVKQACKYANAIDSSVVAAQKAYTIAEDAISLADRIQNSTPDEHQSFLVGMLELARDGRITAIRTREIFRNVRADVLALLKKVVEHEGLKLEFSKFINGQWTVTNTTFRELSHDLRNGIEDLEQFSKHIDNFVTWWNWMKMDTNAQHERTKINYNSLREQMVVRKWRELQLQFASYSDDIGRIQDCYPNLFILSRKSERRQKEGKGFFNGLGKTVKRVFVTAN